MATEISRRMLVELIGRIAGAVALTVVAVSIVGAQGTQRAWLANVFAVATIFLIAYVLRRRTMPKALPLRCARNRAGC